MASTSRLSGSSTEAALLMTLVVEMAARRMGARRSPRQLTASSSGPVDKTKPAAAQAPSIASCSPIQVTPSMSGYHSGRGSRLTAQTFTPRATSLGMENIPIWLLAPRTIAWLPLTS